MSTFPLDRRVGHVRSNQVRVDDPTIFTLTQRRAFARLSLHYVSSARLLDSSVIPPQILLGLHHPRRYLASDSGIELSAWWIWLVGQCGVGQHTKRPRI